jgi:hypothetical protein
MASVTMFTRALLQLDGQSACWTNGEERLDAMGVKFQLSCSHMDTMINQFLVVLNPSSKLPRRLSEMFLDGVLE